MNLITLSKQATATIKHLIPYSSTLLETPFFFIFSTYLATYAKINYTSQTIAKIKLPRAMLPRWYLNAHQKLVLIGLEK